MSLLIRPALAEEAAALQALVPVARRHGRPPVTETYVASHPVFAAWEGPRLSGFFALEGGEPEWLTHLWVAEGQTGRGRGRWMLLDAVRRARRRRARVLLLEPEPDCRAFFERMGAEPARGGPDGRLRIDLGAWAEPLPVSVSEVLPAE